MISRLGHSSAIRSIGEYRGHGRSCPRIWGDSL